LENNGGIIMSKSFVMTIMMALLLIAVLVMPVSAFQKVGTVVKPGATVFIGEEGLDMSLVFETTPTTTFNLSNISSVVWNNQSVLSWSNTTVDSGWVNLTTSKSNSPNFVNSSITNNITIDGETLTSKIWFNTTNGIGGSPYHYYNNAKVITSTNISTFISWNNVSSLTWVNTSTPVVSYVSGGSGVGYWASAANIDTSSPTKTYDLSTDYKRLTIGSSLYSGYTGNWYHYNGVTRGDLAFVVADPYIDVSIYDRGIGESVNGKSVVQGQNLTFKIETNMNQIGNGKRTNVGGADIKTTGFIDIKMKSGTGATYTALAGDSPEFKLTNIYPLTTPMVMDGNWNTAFIDNDGQRVYPQGTYTITAESTLNNMKDNYRNGGADYTGKTVSSTYTVSIVSDSVNIVANKDVVVRGKSFSVTITGSPKKDYYVWVKGMSTLPGTGYDGQPPMIKEGQEGVLVGDSVAGAHLYENGGNVKTIIDDVPKTNAGRYYANITTSSSGTRTVEFSTTNWTKAQKYTIRVEGKPVDGNYKSDEVSVKVDIGGVSITAAGDQSYFLGEEIKFSGTNTETYNTYLFLIGPNLPSGGANIASSNPRDPTVKVKNGEKTNFKSVEVNGDNTWSWKWGTAAVALDAGTYTIYAVSQPNDRDNLQNVAYGTVSIIIKKPFVSASASQPVIAKGDRLFITGTAEGNPSQGVAVWILGKNYAIRKTEAVSADSSFKYEITQGDTKALASGQYFIVVQHPMQNDKFDIQPSGEHVMNMQLGSNGTTVFKMLGGSSLQGSDAAEALVQAINDPNVDDTYTKLQVLVEEPVIRIDPIGNKHVGDKFTITGQTNLAIDDEILVEVYSSSFKPTQKTQSGEFSGVTGAIKVAKGDGGLNKISIDVDSSTFKVDEYIVTAKAIIQDATGTALFTVNDSPVPTPVVTSVVTISTPIPIAPTAAPTAAVTTVAVPTTTKSPGYGALVALVGLAAVAFIVVRRE
jgi:PGF-CTERM protein